MVESVCYGKTHIDFSSFTPKYPSCGAGQLTAPMGKGQASVCQRGPGWPSRARDLPELP